jgi:hypothetical protein
MVVGGLEQPATPVALQTDTPRDLARGGIAPVIGFLEYCRDVIALNDEPS